MYCARDDCESAGRGCKPWRDRAAVAASSAHLQEDLLVGVHSELALALHQPTDRVEAWRRRSQRPVAGVLGELKVAANQHAAREHDASLGRVLAGRGCDDSARISLPPRGLEPIVVALLRVGREVERLAEEAGRRALDGQSTLAQVAPSGGRKVIAQLVARLAAEARGHLRLGGVKGLLEPCVLDALELPSPASNPQHSVSGGRSSSSSWGGGSRAARGRGLDAGGAP